MQYDVIVLTETWLYDEIGDSELKLFNYNIFRSDRNSLFASRGGGVLIAVRNDIQSEQISITDSQIPAIDQLFVRVSFLNVKTIFGAFYVPPSSDISCYEEHICSLQECKLDFPNDNYIVLGDYNLPRITWKLNENQCQFCPNHDIPPYLLEIFNYLVNSMFSLNLFQRNYFQNFYDNVLDLCFSNCECKLSLVLEEFINPDIAHPAFDLCAILTPSNSTYDIYSTISYDYFKLDFKSANFNVINAKLSEINWNEELNSLSVIEAIDKFYSIILTIIDNEVPKKHIKLSTFPNWFSKNLIDLIFKKKCAHKKYKYHLEINDTCNINTYRYEFFYLRMQCKKEMKNCYNNYLRYVEGSLNNNVKKFWDFIRSKNNTNGYPNKMHLENSYSSDCFSIANLFKSFFSGVYSENPSSYDSQSLLFPSDVIADNIDISPEEILQSVTK